MSFQNAKDTFYLTLRDRLAVLNPDRTVVVRSGTRPGILVEENESADAPGATVSDVFILHWTGFTSDTGEALPLERARCEVRYATGGLPEVAGMDRGRALQAMDEELQAMLQPASAPLVAYGGAAPVTGTSRVFWSDAEYGNATVAASRLERVVTVEVFAWKEEL